MPSTLEKIRKEAARRAFLLSRRIAWSVPRLQVDRDQALASSVLLIGTGRSGTSWIPGIINYDNRYRYMSEPFHPKHVRLVADWPGVPYIRSTTTDERWVAPARAILSGKIHGSWVDAHNKRLFSNKRLIKDVRVVMSAKWIRTRFPELRIIYVMRHPCAVALSRTQLHWSADLKKPYLSQPELVEDFLRPFMPLIAATTDEFEIHILEWCIQNYVALSTLRAGDVHLAFYEGFCVDPRAELQSVFRYLGEPFDERALQQVRKPSYQTRKYHGGGTSAIVTGESLVDGWRKWVDADRLRRALALVEQFGLDSIYGAGSMPNVDNALRRLVPAGADAR